MILNKLPIIVQMRHAPDDAARADILLRCPDSILLEYAGQFAAACQDFPDGQAFVAARLACLLAVRGAGGGLPGATAMTLAQSQAQLLLVARRPDPPPLDI